MKKILYIRENLPGGTDNYCKALCNLLKNDEELLPISVYDIPASHSKLFHYLYKSAALKKAIMEADIIHINGYTAGGTIQAFLTANKYGKKIIYTAHWHPFECLRHPLLGKVFFYCFMRPIITKYAHTVTTINNEDTAFFKRIHNNVIQIPHWFTPTEKKQQTIKKKDMILFIGRTDVPVKGIEHLYQIPQGLYDIHCVGKGQIERPDFHQHIGISDDELAKLYTEASLVVIPSKYEAFSYVALEAMSYGTPILMSERVRIADYLNGIEGYQIFKYGDYNDFLNKINYTIGTAVDTAKIKPMFAIEKIRNAYRSIYLS